MSTAPSTAPPTSSRPTSPAPSTCWKPPAPTGPPRQARRLPLPPHLHRRGLRLPRRRRAQFTETHPLRPRSSPYSASKAASDHLVRAWAETYGLPVVLTNCSNNYGPYHFPEKLIPVIILNALARQAHPGLRHGRERPRLALRRGPRRRPPRSSLETGQLGAQLQHRRRERARATSTSSAPSAPSSTRCAPKAAPLRRPDHLRHRPPRPRRPLRHRPHPHPRRTRLAPLGHARGRPAPHRPLVSRQRSLVARRS